MTTLIEEIKGGEELAAQKEKNMTGPIVNPIFQDLLDTQTPASYEELKKGIVADGIRDPITVWKEENTLVDGHNRLKIATELGIPCPTVEKSFKDEAEVKQWIIRNQLGRRNLTPARFEYYIGRLYNEQKAETSEEKIEAKGSTAEKLAKEFDVSEKTVRRYGTQAKGIDMIEKVRGKLAKTTQLSSKPTYTTEEVAVLATAANTTVASKTLKNIDAYKKQKADKKQQDKAVKAVVEQKQTLYNVALCEPDFEASGFSVTTEPKPALDKSAVVYLVVPDEYLSEGMKLIDKWGLVYEASFVFWNNQPYDGVYSKIVHQFVLMATKGTVTGPKLGSEAPSCQLLNGALSPVLIKLIDSYHNGNAKKIDMRVGQKPGAGWDGLTK